MPNRQRLFSGMVTIMAATALMAPQLRAQDAPEARREVRVGLVMTDLSEVRDAEQAFDADVFLLATWFDPNLAGGSEEIRTLDLGDVWHPTLLIYNQRSVRESMPEKVTVQPDGTVNYMQRYQGLFSATMDLRDFPLDRQEFSVWLVSPVWAGAAVNLVPDESLAAYRAEDLSISDWRIGEPTLTVKPFQLAPDGQSNPGIILTVPGTRLLTYYTVQVLIPLVAVVLMAWAVFWLGPAVVPTRVGVPLTTMLTLIAYRFMLGNYVPRLSYLTRLDWFTLGATVMVLLNLLTMAATAYLVRKGREDDVNAIDRGGRVVYPVVFAVYSLIVFLL
jgi:hypothetical protein